MSDNLQDIANLDIEANLEMGILGSIILNNEMIDSLEFLKPEHFSYSAHQKLFKHLKNCIQNEDKKIGAPTLGTYFKLESSMKDLGGVDHLKRILASVGEIPMMLSAKDYAKNLVEIWQKRELSELLENLDKSKTLEEIKNEINDKLDLLESENQQEPRLVNDLMKDFIVRKVENKEIGELVKTNYPVLDQILSGFYAANLITIAGKTSMGKSAFALNLAKKISETTENKQGDMTYFLSIEMKSDEVLGRFLVDVASINGYRLRNAELKPIEEQAVMLAKREFNLRLLLDDTCGLNVNQIWARAKKMKSKYGIKVMVIDHLQKIIPINPKESRERQVGLNVERLKDMAKKLDITVILLCQLSRENEKRPNKRPILSDLRESGTIEQESDVVMFVHRDEYYLEKEAEPKHSPNYGRWLDAYNSSKGRAHIIISKNRNGETGESEMFFEKQFQRFMEISTVN